jgi:hypothetical protein
VQMTNQHFHEIEKELPKGVSKPALRALIGAGYFKWEQLAHATEAELLALHGIGPKAMGPLREALQARGLSFKEHT